MPLASRSIPTVSARAAAATTDRSSCADAMTRGATFCGSETTAWLASTLALPEGRPCALAQARARDADRSEADDRHAPRGGAALRRVALRDGAPLAALGLRACLREAVTGFAVAFLRAVGHDLPAGRHGRVDVPRQSAGIDAAETVLVVRGEPPHRRRPLRVLSVHRRQRVRGVSEAE